MQAFLKSHQSAIYDLNALVHLLVALFLLLDRYGLREALAIVAETGLVSICSILHGHSNFQLI